MLGFKQLAYKYANWHMLTRKHLASEYAKLSSEVLNN